MSANLILIKYPLINRSNFEPRFCKEERDDQIDCGWGEGVLNDGRPYRAELWAAYQMTHLTFYISTIGLEDATEEELKEYLISKGLVEFDDEKYEKVGGYTGINLSARKIKDPDHNEFWELTITVGDEDGTYLKDSVRLNGYSFRKRLKKVLA